MHGGGVEGKKEHEANVGRTRRTEREPAMLVTTTNTVDGHEINNYLRVVSGETVAGINALKDIGASFRNLVGGRSGSYEGEIRNARESALAEMVDRAIELGAHGVVGVGISYQSLGDGAMILVSATGTAVTFAN